MAASFSFLLFLHCPGIGWTEKILSCRAAGAFWHPPEPLDKGKSISRRLKLPLSFEGFSFGMRGRILKPPMLLMPFGACSAKGSGKSLWRRARTVGRDKARCGSGGLVA